VAEAPVSLKRRPVMFLTAIALPHGGPCGASAPTSGTGMSDERRVWGGIYENENAQTIYPMERDALSEVKEVH
jgi:hypothetical protein